MRKMSETETNIRTEEKKATERFIDRQTAVKLDIDDINNSVYTKTQGEFTPNYIETLYQEQISRVNVIGVIINKEQEPPAGRSIIIDDSTGRITLRVFEVAPSVEELKVGDIIRVIGRPREFNNMMYIIPEIIKRVESPTWLQVRKLELELHQKNRPEKRAKAKAAQQEAAMKEKTTAFAYEEENINDREDDDEKTANKNPQEKNQFERFVEVVKQLDIGDGADMETVIARFEGDGEKLMRILLEEGEVFEVKPGKIKVLE